MLLDHRGQAVEHRRSPLTTLNHDAASFAKDDTVRMHLNAPYKAPSLRRRRVNRVQLATSRVVEIFGLMGERL